MVDKSGSGRVDPWEFMEFLKEVEGADRIGEEDMDDIFREIDGARVGFLTYEDFVYMLLPK